MKIEYCSLNCSKLRREKCEEDVIANEEYLRQVKYAARDAGVSYTSDERCLRICSPRSNSLLVTIDDKVIPFGDTNLQRSYPLPEDPRILADPTLLQNYIKSFE